MTASANDAVAIRARGVVAQLGGAVVLHGIDLDLPRGRWTSVVGPNGAGKSTLLKALAQLIPHQGTVELLDQPMAKLSARARAQRLAWLGQNESTGDDLRVWDVAMLGRLPHQAWLAAPSAADHQAVEQALRATQAWDWRERALGHLSGGERQRVLLARALAVQADVLLMDEPLANLDPPHQADWLAVVHQLLAQGRTVVSVLHEISFALHADTMLIIDQGRVLHHGACNDALTHRRLEQVFDQRISIVPVAGQWVVLSRVAEPLPGGAAHDAADPDPVVASCSRSHRAGAP
jgi:iron complex transport system ATP-binding protein